MKNLKVHFSFAEFIGLGIAWQYDRVAIIFPFLMIEVVKSRR